MKVLVVAPYPPYRDGVGRYAQQQVRALRRIGDEVKILSPMPSAADLHVPLKGGFRLTRIKRIGRGFDRVVLHYQPSHFHAGRGVSRFCSTLTMWWTFATSSNLEIICHEVEYPGKKWKRALPYFLFEARAWKSAKDVAFHSRAEIDAMEERFGIRLSEPRILDHGAAFNRACSDSREVARRKLGIDADRMMFLCIGFIQEQKGFDRAMVAFQGAAPDKAMLAVVGSLGVATPEQVDYLRSLESLASTIPDVSIREGMLSDEEFDRWIIASDFVLLPYRQIWSSGVLERAKLLDRPVIATAVGGIPEQIGSGLLVRDTDELRFALKGLVEMNTQGPPDPNYRRALQEVSERLESKRSASGGERHSTGMQTDDRPFQTGRAIAQSSRPFLGPLVTLVKRVILRLGGWLILPLYARLGTVERSTKDVLESMQKELDRLGQRLARLEEGGVESGPAPDQEESATI